MRPDLISLLVAASLCSTAPAWADTTVDADPHGIVEISNVSGRIDVSGWDQPQVSVRSNLSKDSKDLTVEGGHGRTSIHVSKRGFFGGSFDDDVILTIKVPKGSEVDASGVSADITSKGVFGNQRLKAVSGSIRAEIGKADVEAKTISGDIQLRGIDKPTTLHLSSISGAIMVDNAAGDLEATTTSGDLRAELDPARSVRARTTSGRMEVRGKLTKDAEVDVQTVSGDVGFHTALEGGLEYEANSFSGDIHNCFGAQAQKTSQYGPGTRLTGTRGGEGGARMRVKTMSGEIELCDKR
jgi:DUF4097 and DUF4098 domain-containing protein YvlB